MVYKEMKRSLQEVIYHLNDNTPGKSRDIENLRLAVEKLQRVVVALVEDAQKPRF